MFDPKLFGLLADGLTDKASNGYRVPYASLLAGTEVESLLEVGIYSGGSLVLWANLFPRAKITGVDIADHLTQDNRETLKALGVNVAFFDAYASFPPLFSKYDVIIDDGSHEPEHQVFFVQEYVKLLSDRGVLVVEDILSADTVPLLYQALDDSLKPYSYLIDVTTQAQSWSRMFVVDKRWLNA
jgi:predicted O-methyltransferase YrrM